MADTKGYLLLTPDPKSLFLSHHPDANFSGNNQKLQLTSDSYFMERGTRYKAYAQLRESKLRSRRLEFDEDERESKIPRSEITPPAKKSVRFQENFPSSAKKKQGCSVLAQSVPDFSSALRKENRKPPENIVNVNRIPRPEKSLTPPPSVSRREKMYGSGGGSKSVNAGEKQSEGRLMMMGRKSYASMEELKGLSIATSNAINGENRGGKRVNVLRKSTVLSTRYY